MRKTGMKGVLVIDNTSRGIGKGGTRMQPTVSVEEIARLARVMTWKWAGVDLFYGGAKAGIRADPRSPTRRRSSAHSSAGCPTRCPDEYVFGLDMGLTENDAAIINDELGDRGAAVGTPYDSAASPTTSWGSPVTASPRLSTRPRAATGCQGSALPSRASVRWATPQRSGSTGWVTRWCRYLRPAGALHNPNGLDVPALLELRRDLGDAFVSALPELKIEAGRELFVDADIVVPAALQDVIDGSSAANIKGRLLVEGANLPTNAAAQNVLRDAGVTVVPDFVANAGGVVSAAFAMDARYSAFRPETARFLRRFPPSCALTQSGARGD